MAICLRRFHLSAIYINIYIFIRASNPLFGLAACPLTAIFLWPCGLACPLTVKSIFYLPHGECRFYFSYAPSRQNRFSIRLTVDVVLLLFRLLAVIFHLRLTALINFLFGSFCLHSDSRLLAVSRQLNLHCFGANLPWQLLTFSILQQHTSAAASSTLHIIYVFHTISSIQVITYSRRDASQVGMFLWISILN